MKQALLSLKAFFEKNKALRLLLATFFASLGVWASNPTHGVIASVPLQALCSALAMLICGRFALVVGIGLVLALFYASAIDLADPASFTLSCAVGAITGAVLPRLLYRILKDKKKILIPLVPVCLAAAIAAPLFFFGTPAAQNRAKDEAEAYLAKTYPDQLFSSVTVYRDRRENAWQAEVRFEHEGNTLSAPLTFGENGVKDGFRDLYAIWMLDVRKAQMIQALEEPPHALVFDSIGLTEEGKRLSVYPGTFGHLSEEMIPYMHFHATFREEKTNRRVFATAIEETLSAWKSLGLAFGQITFFAQDAGEEIYSCTVTPATDTEEILSLIQAVK